MDYKQIVHFAESIINESLTDTELDYTINNKLSEYENSIFNIDNNVQILLNNNINFKSFIKLLPEEIPDNLKYLKKLSGQKIDTGIYPIKKIILCEGITEEILLPKFAQICNFSFPEHGIHIVSAGGKNQVVKYFYNYAESLKIPIFILLDNDAKENLEQIKPRLRKIDKIHLVKSGEFEDLLPKSLIIKTLNYLTKNISMAPIEGLEDAESTVEFLEEFFRHRGLHEFKKADFAQSVKENISDIKDISPEIFEIINELNTI
jgi:hypothetical protein